MSWEVDVKLQPDNKCYIKEQKRWRGEIAEWDKGNKENASKRNDKTDHPQT
jgi:hypothetical protein